MSKKTTNGFTQENPPERTGPVGRTENPLSRKAIDTVTANPNIWFKVKTVPYENTTSHCRASSYGQSVKRKAAREGHTLEFASRKVGSEVRVYLKAVVES